MSAALDLVREAYNTTDREDLNYRTTGDYTGAVILETSDKQLVLIEEYEDGRSAGFTWTWYVADPTLPARPGERTGWDELTTGGGPDEHAARAEIRTWLNQSQQTPDQAAA